MKKLKGNGFTLIELLAIIIILGIIAVIAVPTVKKLTDEAKLKAFENTARGIIKAGNLYYSRKDMMDAIEGDMEFTFPDNAEELELQGELPENGKMIINEDGDIALAIANKKYCITKSIATNEIEIKEDYETCTIPNPYMTSTHTCVTSGTCTQEEIIAGIKVNVKVNNKQNYDFYVIADTGTELTLLMDRNLGDNVAWYTSHDNSKGPTNAIAELNARTSEWINIPEKTYTVSGIADDEETKAYDDIIVTGRSRLLTQFDVESVSGTGTVQSWMKTNLVAENTDGIPNGYWLSTADSTDSRRARYIAFEYNYSSINLVGYDNKFGLRPVINISK